MQWEQDHLCGPLMRSNCCCDSHSTTRQVSCKKGSISYVAWTQACSPPLLLLLLLLLRDVVGFRGRRLEVKGWGDGVIVLESMRICRPHENRRAVILDFSMLRPIFIKGRFQVLRFQDLCGWSAKTMKYMCVFEWKCKKMFLCGRPLEPLHSVKC